jgi:hypothetical protein
MTRHTYFCVSTGQQNADNWCYGLLIYGVVQSRRNFLLFTFPLIILIIFMTTNIAFSTEQKFQSSERRGTIQAIDVNKNTGSSNSLIDIKIEPTRPQATAGAGIGIIAEIKNTSASTVYLKGKNLTLTLPPELEAPFSWEWGWWAIFPTEEYDPKNPNAIFEKTISLKAGDAYNVFWIRNPTESATGVLPSLLIDNTPVFFTNLIKQVTAELNYIFFTPGDYKITVVAKYWIESPGSHNDQDEAYRTVNQSALLRVAAPSSVIILGAALGGLIAYFLLPQTRFSLEGCVGRSGLWARRIAGIFVSMLLSTMVAILLSRVSDVPLPIRVTVTDFWGAIAIGFLANYAGSQLLDRFSRQSQRAGRDQPSTASTQVTTPEKPPGGDVGSPN